MSIVEVRFGDIAGVLHRPPDATACVVLGHGFSATVEAGLERYCARFAAVGFAALAFDYRRFGASCGEPREVLVVEDQLADWADALRFARSIEGIDRIAIWGTSYGGGHVLEAAARDGGVAAVVSQV
ncbi:MAG: alpha/beta hydrolase, partial [Solirubrobacteraceae bacterium]